MEENSNQRERENIEAASPKEVYVVNLDHRRIFLLSGSFLLLLGVAFWLGSSLNTSNRYQAIQEQETQTFSLDTIEDSEALRRRAQEELTRLENPPSVQGQQTENVFNASIPVREDPVVSDNVSSRSTSSHSYTNKKQTRISVSSSHSQTDGFYTVQVAAYKHEKDARRVARDLQTKGIAKVRVDRGILYYYVRAGKAVRENSLVSLNQKIEKILDVKSKIIFKKS